MSPAAHQAMREQILIRALRAVAGFDLSPKGAAEVLAMQDGAASVQPVITPRLELACAEMRR